MNPLKLLGAALVVLGLVGILYFALAFDISVPVAPVRNPYTLQIIETPDRVSNLGLMNDRLIGIIGSSVALLAGLVLVLIPGAQSGSVVRPRIPIAHVPSNSRQPGYVYDDFLPPDRAPVPDESRLRQILWERKKSNPS